MTPPPRAFLKVVRYALAYLLAAALILYLLSLLPRPLSTALSFLAAALFALGALLLLHALLPALHLATPALCRLPRRCREANQVALTFDDGPVEPYTRQILDILRAHQAPATFFVIGENARAYPELVRRMAAEGHAVGNHTAGHTVLLGRRPAEVLAEVEEGAQAIEEILGRRPRWLRFPKGYRPLGWTRRLARQGWQLAFWTFPIYDVQNPPPAELVRRVLSRVRAGDIILMHDGFSRHTRSVRDRSSLVAALPEIVKGLKERNLSLITLEQV